MRLQRIYEYFHLFVKGKILSEHMFEFFVFHAAQEHISRSFDHVNLENL
jgi:hypothetical protein